MRESPGATCSVIPESYLAYLGMLPFITRVYGHRCGCDHGYGCYGCYDEHTDRDCLSLSESFRPSSIPLSNCIRLPAFPSIHVPPTPLLPICRELNSRLVPSCLISSHPAGRAPSFPFLPPFPLTSPSLSPNETKCIESNQIKSRHTTSHLHRE